MASARDRLLKGKKSPSKSISLDEAIANGNQILNDPLSDPDLTAPKQDFELSSTTGEETKNSEELENLMNMSTSAQETFNNKLRKAKEDKNIENMFARVQEAEEAQELEKSIPVKEEKVEDIELTQFNNVPDFKLDFGSSKQEELEESFEEEEVKEEIEETIEEQPAPVVEEPKPVVKETPKFVDPQPTIVQAQQPKIEVKPVPVAPKVASEPVKGGNTMTNSMMDKMMRTFALQLIANAKAQGVAVEGFTQEEVDQLYDYIESKINN